MKILLLFVLALCKLSLGEEWDYFWMYGDLSKSDLKLLNLKVEDRYVGPNSSSETEIIFPDPDENPQFNITYIGFTTRPHPHNVKIQSGGIGHQRVNLLISRKRMQPKKHMPMGNLVIYGRHKSCVA